MKTLDLHLQSKSLDYQILIGKDLLSQNKHFTPVIQGQQVFIVSNKTVAPLYLETLQASLKGYECSVFLLEDGEQHKSFASYQHILDAMLDAGLRRNATLIALGGGVVGDMAGFAAATYQRGIRFLQIPTTLLSQVDSSVGGKTAVNHPKGKNLIGAFHQPSRVITDINTLTTLPDREFKAGIAEIVKAAILYDVTFFEWLETNVSKILSHDEEILVTMIERSCAIKAEIVSLDEKETGVRAWLNLGHTFGHAIERSLGYGELLHGEAVAVGIAMAAEYAVKMFGLPSEDSVRIVRLIESFGLPINIQSEQYHINATILAEAMTLDKKNVDADLTLVLPKSIGEVTIKHSVKVQDVERFLVGYLDMNIV
ncbi:3-dehydroquinate synthase [Kangiella marina]|uniref:3-dehydroquinate synthase n=1 Tax=Kangiella marina TaxID=1079178 RepID=A0ABP8IHC8_9GAMM